MALFKRPKSIGSFANLNLQKDSNGIHSEEEYLYLFQYITKIQRSFAEIDFTANRK